MVHYMIILTYSMYNYQDEELMQLCLEFVVAYTHNEFQDFDLVLVSEIKMRAISKNNNYTIKLFTS